jgi:hypothetical protein
LARAGRRRFEAHQSRVYINNGSAKPPTPETEAAVRKIVGLFKSLGVTVVDDAG